MKINYPNFDQLTPLQRHVAFFDRDQDGVLTVSETAQGLRALGQNRFVAAGAAALIHLGLAKPVNDSYFKLDMKIADIQKGKHDSDTDVYTATGQVDQARFEKLFNRFDTNKSGSLSAPEIANLRAYVKGKEGSAAATAEWTVFMSLLSDCMEIDGDGKTVKAISKAGLSSFYAGTLMFEKEAQLAGVGGK